MWERLVDFAMGAMFVGAALITWGLIAFVVGIAIILAF